MSRGLDGGSNDAVGADPPYLFEPYVGTRLRAPKQALVFLPLTETELAEPVYGHTSVSAADADLTNRHEGEPQGQRIVVSGRVLDEDGRPVRDSLIEIWQCNAAGRYRHDVDRHDAPLDPNFDGAGRCLTDSEGGYRFVTIKPGAYPWRNHDNAWRPAHIHFSLFGRAFTQRLVTQMYFPDDPLFPYDPIMGSIPDERARQRLISQFDLATTIPETALGFRFDIVLRSTSFEE
jgi:protocatechuate 3,4-dioxygenase beta subunit